MKEPAINSRSRDPAAIPENQIINNFNNSMKNHTKSNLIFIHKISNHMKTKYDLKRLWLTRGVFALFFTMLLLVSGLVSAQTLSLTVYGPGNVTLSSSDAGVTFQHAGLNGGIAAATLIVPNGQYNNIAVAGTIDVADNITVNALGAPFY
ncbi:MAG: hypothetical protein Q8T08_04200, partial [Ignavibacteria bacterium]|nr:hypothetical protein [Ignavibacteria bacterium]